MSDLTPERANNLRHCPTHFQDYIEKRSEVRAYIVGNKVFSAEILSQDHTDTSVDWRRYPTRREGDDVVVDSERWKSRPITLPDDINKKLVLLARRLSMVYAAVDLIQTPQNDFVFLEANSSGAFQFIEEMVGLPISAEVAKLLVDGSF
jgi:glutathione synthase/RimK-type ligase-like ATP-grasp enzyme